MQKIILIAALSFVTFIIESAIFNVLGPWLKPNLLILLVIYITLTMGIRYGLIAALFCGILKDSYSIDIFGLNIFTFLAVAYLSTLTKRYLNLSVSKVSRIIIVLIVCVISVLIRFILASMYGEVDFGQMILYVMLPETIMTTIAATYTFQQIRKCVLRLSV